MKINNFVSKENRKISKEIGLIKFIKNERMVFVFITIYDE